MKQKSLARWLKGILIGMGLFGLVMYGAVIPVMGNELAEQYSEYAHCYYPWVVFLWLTAIPCYIVLYLGWRIASNIGSDNSFCMKNAVSMKLISMLAAGDSGFFLIGNVVYWLMDFSHPSVVLAAFGITFIGVAIAVTAAVLSHLIRKAAEMKEENDLTI